MRIFQHNSMFMPTMLFTFQLNPIRTNSPFSHLRTALTITNKPQREHRHGAEARRARMFDRSLSIRQKRRHTPLTSNDRFVRSPSAERFGGMLGMFSRLGRRSERKCSTMEAKVTIPALQQMKRDRRKIAGVVAWDYQL